MSRFLTLDTETTGRDLYHGSRPFIVTTCTDDGKQWTCEWDVDPLDRYPSVDPGDVAHLRELVNRYDTLVFHNAKFDVTALATIGVIVPWGKVEDTIVASHVLDSISPHNLTDLASRYLNENILPYEQSLEHAVKTARRRVQSARLKDKRLHATPEEKKLAKWQIAVEDMDDLPSAKGGGKDGEGKLWRNDYWLPAAFARHFPENPEYAGWATTCLSYANIDSSVTALLWPVLRRAIENRKLWKVYRAKFACVPAAYRMERRGVTLDLSVMRDLEREYGTEAKELADLVVGIARSMNYDLTLPKSTTNHCLDDFVFGRAPRNAEDGKRNPKGQRRHAPDTLNLTPLRETESGNPSFDYDARELYLGQLEPGTKPHLFVESFSRMCELNTGLSYLAGYERYAIPTDTPNVAVLHPNLNTTGTATTRWSHSNPNSANVSKQSAVNLRKAFRPAPGREWYSMDAAGIELVIPAIRANEEEVLRVMLNPDDPPYYGSYHLLIFDTLRPELFAKYGKECKALFEDAEYTWTKSFTFSRQYGAQKQKADATARLQGACDRVGNRFPKIDALIRDTIALARETGGVETIPDASVDPTHGYPIRCRRGPYGNVPSTVPFAYFVSGSAGWWMTRCITRWDAQLEEWRREEGFDGHLILQVHDEGVFDFPLDQGDNVPRVNRLRELAEQCGRDMGIPIRVSVERHRESWAVGEVVK